MTLRILRNPPCPPLEKGDQEESAHPTVPFPNKDLEEEIKSKEKPEEYIHGSLIFDDYYDVTGSQRDEHHEEVTDSQKDESHEQSESQEPSTPRCKPQ